MASRTGNRAQHFSFRQVTRQTSAAATTISDFGAAYARRTHVPLVDEAEEDIGADAEEMGGPPGEPAQRKTRCAETQTWTLDL
jgi:hypothetical protein